VLDDLFDTDDLLAYFESTTANLTAGDTQHDREDSKIGFCIFGTKIEKIDGSDSWL